MIEWVTSRRRELDYTLNEANIKAALCLGREVSGIRYLSRLSPQDRAGLEGLISAFGETMEAHARPGVLIAAGGSLYKPLPRKDIDIAFVFGGTKPDNIEGRWEHWEVFQQLVTETLRRQGGYTDVQFRHPRVDWDYGDYFLSYGGADTKPSDQARTPLQIIRWNVSKVNKWRTLVGMMRVPYAELADFSDGVTI